MEIKVREMSELDSKSSQEIEKELLEKHEQQFSEVSSSDEVEVVSEPLPDETTTEAPEEEATIEEVAQQPYDLKEEDVLSYIGNRYGKEINSIEELMSEREKAEEMPEDVAAYFKYKKETGRGISDFVKLQQDYTTMNPDSLLKEYLTLTEEGLDAEDIESLMEDYSYDEELDDESDVRKTKLAKKKIIAKANRFFKEQQELYKQPLESSGSSNEANEELQAYKQYLNTAKTQQEEANRKREWFVKKSDEVFGSEFKGFKFKLNDEEIMFSPGGASELKKAQETPMNFVHKYMDSQGLLNDAEGYHRSLAMAMNPDKFAQFFFEQGKSKATEDVIRKTKNINMSERKAPEVSTKGGMQVKSISEPSGNRLRIKSVKRT
jgi:hypothetical protein|tara:strand:+ start:163 stop:1296 length:1134 start_codon:yes stop_codon:yes gene_type:complete